jgi:alanine racemase
MIEGIVTWAEIDLDAVEHNVRAFKRHVGELVEVFAVVKANAYGHGAAPVALSPQGGGSVEVRPKPPGSPQGTGQRGGVQADKAER